MTRTDALVERLWSPWRLPYVSGAEVEAKECVFCAALNRRPDEPLLLYRGRTCFVILNLYPYNNGHLMVVPNRHVAGLGEASAEELTELMLLTRHAERALHEVYRPHGLNVGMNLGRSAGAGIADHLHIHVVPRWAGDTNFMSVVANVRVLPEELLATASRLRPVFERVAAEGAPAPCYGSESSSTR